MSRREELAANLDAVRARIAAAEHVAGRAPGSVDLVVVTKFFPASDVLLLADLGVSDVAENRHQEAEAKAADVAAAGVAMTWHFIGGLQTNKAAAVAGYADVVESVDRPELIGRLARGAEARGTTLDVLLQVSLDAPDAPDATGRSGAAPEALLSLATTAEVAGLRVRGLMAVAPLGEDPSAAFARLAGIHTSFVSERPDATYLSAGMSGDFEQAIAHGATHVRVGSAILGSRPYVK